MNRIQSIITAFFCSVVFANAQTTDTPQQIVGKMTLQEKAEMVIGHLWNMDAANTEGSCFDYPGLGMPISGVKRLGIPAVICSDGSYGLMKYIKMGNGKYGSTAFPIPIGMASSWNIPLVESVGEAFGNEGLEYGVDILLGPALNIMRDPLCGRNFEYYSEDPLLTGFMASAYVDAIQRQGVGATPKHFAANNQETNRILCDSRVSARALREIYLRAFEHVVKYSNPWSIMTAYNRLNGVQCGENSELMNDVTRGEWGFKGFFMTDFGGEGWSPVQVKAGNDLVMPGSTYHVQNIINAVKEGTLTEAEIDKCCTRILEFIQKTPHYKNYPYSRTPDLEAHAQVARNAALETFVLLKNNGALPLSGSPAFFGCGSYDTKASGIGSGKVTCDYVINIADGFKDKNQAIADYYDQYIRDGKRTATKGLKFTQRAKVLERLLLPETLPEESVLKQAVHDSNIGIFTITRNAGEGADRRPIEGDWLLTTSEKETMRRLADEYHKAGKKLVVILNTASAMETASWKDIPDAILLVWLPGQEGGNAIADVLTGKVSPSGKLTSSFPVRYEDCPTYGNFPVGTEEGVVDYDKNGFQASADDLQGAKVKQENSTYTIFENGKTRHIDKPESEFIKNVDYVNYDEDIYVGYRYYSTFNVPVSYPFGYGLTYTTFAYSDIKAQLPAPVGEGPGVGSVTLTVTNTGNHSAKEIVQVYMEAPNNEAGRPVRELIAFGKTKTLAPGQSETLTMHFNKKDLAWFDNDASAWRLDAGKYNIVCAANVTDKGISTPLIIKKAEVVEKTSNALQPKVKLNLRRSLVGDADYQPVDTFFQGAYIDTDEWRTEPVRHRYIHGGFRNHTTRFSFYFPEKKDYKGRFFQYITPVPDSETLSQNEHHEYSNIGFSVTNGAYFVETNGGGQPDMLDPRAADKTIGAYRANAAAAEFSRWVAKQIYDCPRPYGYSFGGSGGAYRTVGGIENTTTWDGAVPFVLGSPMAIPSVFAVRMHAMRVLRHKLPQIVDALEPGGSGNPYEGLNKEEADALREVTKMGFPLGAWYGWKTMGVHAFLQLYQGVVMADKDYFEKDFWNTPGYLGADKTSSIHRDHLDLSAPIVEIVNQDQAEKMGLVEPMSEADRGSADKAWKSMGKSFADMPVAFRLNQQIPDVGFLGGDMVMLTGKAKKKKMQVLSTVGDYVVLAPGASRLSLAKIKVGDSLNVNNSNFLAAQTYHRHQVPSAEYKVWDQFRDAQGNPIYPQQKTLLGPIFTEAAAGCVPTGNIKGKVILVCSTLDREAYPWQGDWYRSKVTELLGGNADSQFRLWYTDRAVHGDIEGGLDDPTEIVGYVCCLHQALLDVSDWVERGIEPSPTTSYRIEDGQVVLPATARERQGIQPVARLTIAGKKRADIKRGQKVTLTARVDVPQGTGKIIGVEWCSGITKEYTRKADLSEAKRSADGQTLEVTTTFTYDQPGTFFPAVRVFSERQGDPTRIYTQPYNLDRARVVVK